MPIVVAAALKVTKRERVALEEMTRSTSLPYRQVVQAQGLLLAADGVANEEIARRCATTPNTVRRWRARFAEGGIDGVGVIAPGRGRRSWLAEGTVEAVVHDTLLRQARRRIDALDDAVDGGPPRDRQGLRGADLARS